MVRLEDLEVGSGVLGIDPREAVTLLAVQWYGNTALNVTYKNSHGDPGTRLLYREDEKNLSLQQAALPWSFDGKGADFRLAAEAWRIHYAHLFDPYLAVHTSDVEALPHQIAAVYQEMLPRIPLRYVLADDPGAGKTIMTGLFIKELIARGDLKRCLIVSPGSLAEQWQDELFRKFHLNFTILTNAGIEAAVSGNIFQETNLLIARLDKLARNESLQDKLRVTDWDLIVCDEAHKMSATVSSDEIKATRRFRLGRLLSGITRHLLLLTATPHNGKEEDFQLFLSLVDQDRFEGVARTGTQAVDVSDVMRRLVKEDLLKFDGSPLFPERVAQTASYRLSPQEAKLYEAVTAYVRDEFNRADQLDGQRRTNVGFALTSLQRRLASSPEAIYQSLSRRRERLQRRLEEERLGRRAEEASLSEDFDEDDLPSGEQEELEDQLTDSASASRSLAELEAEIATLTALEQQASVVRASGQDSKWQELSRLLQDDKCMIDANGNREKIIIFTEHRDTLCYLTDKIRSLLGRGEESVVVIDGRTLRDERRKVEERFMQDPTALILVATDAAGEGVNLQRAHLMVNYDLPWNPNRLEQRFGRIHRIGQNKTCHLWNLVASETREGAVFISLFAKLEQERKALGGKVYDILGKVFENCSLRDLLIEAVRHDDLKVPAQRAESALDTDRLKELIRANVLVETVMNAEMVAAIRENMERMEARRLQPHFIEAFFREAFKSMGGLMAPRERGRFEITHVPAILRNRDRQIGRGAPVQQCYERVCFDRAFRTPAGALPATLICPGHPLLDALLDIECERGVSLLKRGTVLVDDNDPGETPRLLLFIQSTLQDGRLTPDGGRRILSRQFHFVELAGGVSHGAGPAPYLDYRPLKEEEEETARAHLPGLNFGPDVEKLALDHAVTALVPQHLQEVRSRREALIDKTRQAVKARLTQQIQYWDFRANELKEKEASGKRNAALNSRQAAARADDLAARLEKRLAELDAEQQITALPPTILGGAIILPAGLLESWINPGSSSVSIDVQARKAVEDAAMRAVMALERDLGFDPRDVSADKCGYDIESYIPQSRRTDHALRMIEVKGRRAGADTVTVSRNEMLTAFNKPESFILAIVEVGERTHTVYLQRPFTNPPDFSVESSTFNIDALMKKGEKVQEVWS